MALILVETARWFRLMYIEKSSEKEGRKTVNLALRFHPLRIVFKSYKVALPAFLYMSLKSHPSVRADQHAGIYLVYKVASLTSAATT